MTVITIGLNHRSAPLEVLEGIAISADGVPKALLEITGSDSVNEAVVLSTCNRTEVYVHAERFHDAFHDVRDALAVLSGLATDRFVDHLYVHYDAEAVGHLFNVTAGLDSAVLGEHEILGQVKAAFEIARTEGCAGTRLGQLFEHAIIAGKRVRTETAIGRSTASLSHAAVSLVREQLGSLDGSRALLIGAGDAGSSVAGALTKAAAKQIEDIEVLVTNRTAARAEAVAAAVGATSVPFADLGSAISRANLIISATSAPGYVVNTELLTRARAAEPGSAQPGLLILDLALPRDVDPAVTEIPGVSLITLADLQAFANRGLSQRREAAVEAQAMVAAELERYAEAISVRQIAPLIGGLHQRADQLRADELARQRSRLAGLDDEQRAAVEAVTKALVAKLLHEPTVRLKQAAGSRRGERLAEAARELFDL